mmetsp:Transcript_18751/g.36150  ORF Transcript_18751/g.36150 Transcript_18751/m.36150 type:complete len:209 (-) Transcript_18751:180-806(-)
MFDFSSSSMSSSSSSSSSSYSESYSLPSSSELSSSSESSSSFFCLAVDEDFLFFCGACAGSLFFRPSLWLCISSNPPSPALPLPLLRLAFPLTAFGSLRKSIRAVSCSNFLSFFQIFSSFAFLSTSLLSCAAFSFSDCFCSSSGWNRRSYMPNGPHVLRSYLAQAFCKRARSNASALTSREEEAEEGEGDDAITKRRFTSGRPLGFSP